MLTDGFESMIFGAEHKPSQVGKTGLKTALYQYDMYFEFS
jgi:hypothetical protein